MASDIYGDLPDNERLTGWRPLYPAELLHRYNIALVQGLLVYADDLEVTAADSNPPNCGGSSNICAFSGCWPRSAV